MKKIILILGLLASISAIVFYFSFNALASISGASDNVKAAAIAALVTVITFTAGRIIEQNRERKNKVNSEKIEVYKKFFDLYFKLFSNQEIQERELDPNSIARALVDFQRDVVFWGSDSVIRAFLKFKEELTVSTPMLADTDANKIEPLRLVITAAAELLKAMRRDIGYSFTSFSPRDLAVLQLSGNDPETIKLIESFDR